jgi:hypothetical protein
MLAKTNVKSKTASTKNVKKATNSKQEPTKQGSIEFKTKKINGKEKRFLVVKDEPYSMQELNDLLTHNFLRGNNGQGDDGVADFAVAWHKKHGEMKNYESDIFKSDIAQGRRFVFAFDVKAEKGNLELVLSKLKILYVMHTVDKKTLYYSFDKLPPTNAAKFHSKWKL